MAKGITMKAIADAVGVSVVSVSKALSDKEGVSDEVRELIKKKAREMGYVYRSEQTTEKNKYYSIGVLIAARYFGEDAFYSRMYECIVRETSANGDLCIVENLSEQSEKELILPNMVANRQIDGMIVLGQVSKEYIESLKDCPIPYIFLDFYDEHYDVDGVVNDSTYGSYILTSYLIEKGYTRIAFVGSILATSSICDRYLGYYKALLENGIAVREDWILADRYDDGRFKQVVLPEEMPDAFVCNCDAVAYSVIEMLKAKGYSLPQDIAVVGYDDYLYSKICTPQLTTVKVDMEAMGHEAFKMIVNRIQNPTMRFGRKVVSGKLIVRDSVADRKLV
ncbi:MAG: substrate-binding domain-containing protein [Lachnospiraceae bacterium]